MLAALYRRVST